MKEEEEEGRSGSKKNLFLCSLGSESEKRGGERGGKTFEFETLELTRNEKRKKDARILRASRFDKEKLTDFKMLFSDALSSVSNDTAYVSELVTLDFGRKVVLYTEPGIQVSWNVKMFLKKKLYFFSYLSSFF